jgi:hypothetical protein
LNASVNGVSAGVLADYLNLPSNQRPSWQKVQEHIAKTGEGAAALIKAVEAEVQVLLK